MARAVSQQPHRAQGDHRGGTARGNHGQLDTGHRCQADHVGDVDERLHHHTSSQRRRHEGNELVRVAACRAQPKVAEHAKQQDQHGTAPQAKLLPHDGENEVVGRFRQIEPFCPGLAHAHAGCTTVGEGKEALIGLERGVARVVEMPKQRIYVHSDTAGTEAARKRHTNQTKHPHHAGSDAGRNAREQATAPGQQRRERAWEQQHQGNHRCNGESHAQVPLEDNQPEHGDTHPSKAHKLVFPPWRGGLLVS